MPRHTNPGHRKHHTGLGRPPFEQIALLLQGGGVFTFDLGRDGRE
jgi:hypothetical protein